MPTQQELEHQISHALHKLNIPAKTPLTDVGLRKFAEINENNAGTLPLPSTQEVTCWLMTFSRSLSEKTNAPGNDPEKRAVIPYAALMSVNVWRSLINEAIQVITEYLVHKDSDKVIEKQNQLSLLLEILKMTLITSRAAENVGSAKSKQLTK